MYVLFRFHHKWPMEYFQKGAGEKKIIRAFVRQEIEDRNAEIEAMGGG